MTELHHLHFEGHGLPGTKKVMLGLLQHAVTQELSSVLSSRRIAKGVLPRYSQGELAHWKAHDRIPYPSCTDSDVPGLKAAK